jgi:hypothetical protein
MLQKINEEVYKVFMWFKYYYIKPLDLRNRLQATFKKRAIVERELASVVDLYLQLRP